MRKNEENRKLNYRLTSWFIRIWWFLYAIKMVSIRKCRGEEECQPERVTFSSKKKSERL